MTTRSKPPDWINAFWTWFQKTEVDFILSGADGNEAAAKELADRMSFRMCDFCDGSCPQAGSLTGTPHGPSYCPYDLIRYLYRLRSGQAS